MNDIAITSLISVPVVAACFIVGYMVKNITPLKNKYVPAVVMCTGVIASVILGFVNENEVDAGNILNFIITGAISGLASTGSYEFIMHTLKLRGNNDDADEEANINTEETISEEEIQDVKEICVNDATDEEVYEYNEYNYDYQTSKSSIYNNRVIYMDLDYVSRSSYIRVYSDSSKTTLLKEYKGEDLYNMYHNRKNSITYLASLPSWRYVIDLPDDDDIYVETSSDIGNGYNSGVKYVKQLNKATVKGLWSSSEDLFESIYTLYESVDSCSVKGKSGSLEQKTAHFTRAIGTFDNEESLTFTLGQSVSQCGDYYLVGFTNCDNYNEEDFLQEIEEERYPSSMVCTGNTYHAIWVKHNNTHVDEVATIK